MRSTQKRLMIVIGTRPEAIKLAPVVIEARRDAARFDVQVVTTGQHRELLDQTLAEFEIDANVDLDIMVADQEPCDAIAAALQPLCQTVSRLAPDCVIVQGDTSSTLAGAMAGFYNGVAVAHVEAGLRSFDKLRPFPEEIHRRMTTAIADYHFAHSEHAKHNLLAEGIDESCVWVTGNTAIDILLRTLDSDRTNLTTLEGRTVLLTAHRRENHGRPLETICMAALEILELFHDVRILFPVHPNPRVRRTVYAMLAEHPRVDLVEPMGYREFVRAMQQSTLILTDSGGIQEEAPTLGKPVLVLRESTERPEGIESGAARVVGLDPRSIVAEVEGLLRHESEYARMAGATNPYGDGCAAPRILGLLADALDSRIQGERTPKRTTRSQSSS